MQRWITFLVCGCWAVCASGLATTAGSRERACVLLDRTVQPAVEIGFDYLAPARPGNGRKIDISRWAGRWNAATFYAIGMGDIDLALAGEYWALLRHGYDDPWNHVAGMGWMALEADWTWRYVNDMALRLGSRPGLYAETHRFSAQGFYMPMALSGYWRVNRVLSAMAGTDARFGFREVWIPMLGVAWMPSDRLRVDLMVPESRVEMQLTSRWHSHLAVGRTSRSFATTSGKARHPDRVSFKEYRALGGVTRKLSDDLFMRVDVGWVYDRRVRFDGGGAGSSLHIDDGLTLGVALAGPF